MDARIRKARSEDLQKVLQFIRDSYDIESYKEHSESLLKMWCGDNITFLLLEQVKSLFQASGKVIGYVAYERLPRRILLLNIVVLPLYRMLGNGKSLLRRLEDELLTHHKKYPRAQCLVSEELTGVHFFLKKCGWIAVGVIKPPYFVGSRFVKEHGYLFERRCPVGINLGASYEQEKTK